MDDYVMDLSYRLSANRTRTNKKLFIKMAKTNYGDRSFLSLPQSCGIMACHLTVVEDTGAFENGLKTWIFNKAFGEQRFNSGRYWEALYKY
jgi:hypothetical protein